MNSSTYRFVLDLHSTQSQISLPVLIGDTSRTLRINLSDGCSPYIIEDGCLAKLSIKRPTGTHLEEFCTIENNTAIVYPFSKNENTCAVEGIHNCDVILYGLDGEIIGSPRFTMVVSERVVPVDDIMLTDEDFTAVDAMMKEEASRQVAEQRRAEAEQRRAEAEEERVTAGEVAVQAVRNAKAEADRAASEADRAESTVNEAVDVAVANASQKAEDEVIRLVGELGIVQTTGDRETAAMSQKAVTEHLGDIADSSNFDIHMKKKLIRGAYAQGAFNGAATNRVSTDGTFYLPFDAYVEIASGYKVVVLEYNSPTPSYENCTNKYTAQWIDYSASVIPKNVYCTFTVAKKDNSDITIEEAKNAVKFRVPLDEKIEDYHYTGEALNFGKHSFKVKEILSSPYFDHQGIQGFDIHNGIIAQFQSDDWIYLIDIETGKKIAEYQCYGKHGSTLVFSETYFESGDEFPLLYVCGGNDPTVYVHRINRTGTSLIARIKYTESVAGYWNTACFDFENKKMYVMGYTENSYSNNTSGNNLMKLTTWDMSKITNNADGTISYALESTFTFPYMYCLQSLAFHDGKIFALVSVSGIENTEICVIDPANGNVVANFKDFPYAMSIGEAEGLTFADVGDSSQMIVSVKGGECFTYYGLTFAQTSSSEREVAELQQGQEALVEELENTNERIDKSNERIDKTEKRITNIEQGVMADSFEVDDSVAYVKDVPTNALPYAAISKVGGMTYKDGDVLRSASVTEVGSVGANQLDVSSATVWTSSSYAGNDPLKVERYGAGVKFTVLQEQSTSWLQGGFTIGLTKDLLGKTFTLSVGKVTYSHTTEKSIPTFGFGVSKHDNYYLNGGANWLSGTVLTEDTVTYTIPTDTDYTTYPYVRVVFYPSYGGVLNVGDTVIYEDIMLNKGTTALPCAPYVKRTLSIPAEVRPAHGINNEVYDYLDFGEQESVVRVGVVDMGTLNWGYSGTVFYANTGKIKGISNFLCEKYPNANASDSSMSDKTITGNYNADGYVYVKDSAYTDVASFKAAMAGVMLYYELEEPIITDISDILPADNLIGVEGGGTITMVNEHEYAVPSEIIYQVKGVSV